MLLHTPSPLPWPPSRPDAVLLLVKVRGASREDFIGRYCHDVVDNGIFLRTGDRAPPALGAWVDFRFRLADGRDIFSGQGQVCWVRRRSSGGDAGLGLRFERLLPGSDQVLQELLERREQTPRSGQPVAEFDSAPTRPRVRVIPAVRLAR